MKKLLLTLLGAALALPAMAYKGEEFSYTYEGQTIIYTVIDEVAKTCRTKVGEFLVAGNNVSGDLILPSNPKDGDIEFLLTEIGNYAFSGCRKLTSVTIPNSINIIGSNAFAFNSSLTNIVIPAAVGEIGPEAFRECSKLTEFIVSSDNNVYYSDNGVLYSKNKTKLIQYPNGKEQDEFLIPETVSEIESCAFYWCSRLNSITLPEGLTSIGADAFAYSGLTSISIPNSLKEIGPGTFRGCSYLRKAEFSSIEHLCLINFKDETSNPLYFAHNLYINGEKIKEVVIPESVPSIGSFAFRGCTGLTSVTYLAENPIQCSSNIFSEETYENATLNYLKSAEEKIAATEPWNKFINRVGQEAAPEGSITEVENTATEASTVYDMRGVKVGDSTAGLPKGIYIVREGSTTRKIAI